MKSVETVHMFKFAHQINFGVNSAYKIFDVGNFGGLISCADSIGLVIAVDADTDNLFLFDGKSAMKAAARLFRKL